MTASIEMRANPQSLIECRVDPSVLAAQIDEAKALLATVCPATSGLFSDRFSIYVKNLPEPVDTEIFSKKLEDGSIQCVYVPRMGKIFESMVQELRDLSVRSGSE